jgi:cytochrome c
MIVGKFHSAGAVCSGIAAVAVVLSPTIASAAQDDAAGRQIFAARCAACHSTKPGEGKVGPPLAGIFGRTSGSVSGFKYSAALKKARLTWDAVTLDKWLQSPSRLVHGTTMFANVPSSPDRERLIAYLKTLTVDASSNSK